MNYFTVDGIQYCRPVMLLGGDVSVIRKMIELISDDADHDPQWCIVCNEDHYNYSARAESFLKMFNVQYDPTIRF